MTAQDSAAATLGAARPLHRGRGAHRRTGPSSGRAPHVLYEFIRFGVKQGWACLFGGADAGAARSARTCSIRAAPRSRATTSCSWPPSPSRSAMLAFKLETWEEAKVILIFHVVGTIMEIFKTVGRLLDLSRAELPPHRRRAAVLRLHVRRDRLLHRPLLAAVRFPLHASPAAVGAGAARRSASTSTSSRTTTSSTCARAAVRAAALLFGRCWVYFKVWRVHRRMPLLLGFVLVALFIWFAENIGTFTQAWIYPHQRRAGRLVLARQARRVVPADDHLLRAGRPYILYETQRWPSHRALVVLAGCVRRTLRAVSHAFLSRKASEDWLAVSTSHSERSSSPISAVEKVSVRYIPAMSRRDAEKRARSYAVKDDELWSLRRQLPPEEAAQLRGRRRNRRYSKVRPRSRLRAQESPTSTLDESTSTPGRL